MSVEQYDFIVLGGGSGGLAASKRAASYGAKVALVESSRVGGTCVIRGCIPKKLMVYAANLGANRHLAQQYGWNDDLVGLDWNKLKSFRDNTVKRLEHMHEANLDKAGVTLLRGHGTFVDKNTVQVGSTLFHANKFLIATGSTPIPPLVDGIETAVSSDGLWEIESKPDSITVIGGGYIAVEFASLLQNLGCQTSLVARSSLLRNFDESLGQHLLHCLRQQGVEIYTDSSLKRIASSPNQTTTTIDYEGREKKIFSDTALLFATGRRPNTDQLGLQAVGVQLRPNGGILVDEDHKTSTPHIFAVGDVLGHSMLTPVAIKAGRTVADREFGCKQSKMNYETIPTAIFSRPPVGTVGTSESEAKVQFGDDDIQVYTTKFNPLLYSPCEPNQKIQTFMKLIVRKSTDQVLGFHMVGDDAPEIIQGFAASLMAGITKTQLDATVAIHPSAAEEFVLMR